MDLKLDKALIPAERVKEWAAIYEAHFAYECHVSYEIANCA